MPGSATVTGMDLLLFDGYQGPGECALTDMEPLSHVDFDLMLQLIAAVVVCGDATVQ